MSSPNLTHMTSTKKPRGKRMTEKKLNFIKIEATGFQSICDKLAETEKENQKLKDELLYFKSRSFSMVKRCKTLASENQKLKDENADLTFTHKYLTAEDAGKRFAQELLGNATPSDLAEEKAIADGEAHYERTAFLGDDF